LKITSLFLCYSFATGRSEERNPLVNFSRRCRRDAYYEMPDYEMPKEETQWMVAFTDENDEFKNCDSDSIIFHGNDPVPEVRLKGFYMPKYGAGRFFDKGKNYLGLVIMAVQKDEEWYADHDKPFRTVNINPTTKRRYRTSIRPGYIIMQNDEYLIKNYPQGLSLHEKLFLDFTGKTVNELAAENVKYLGWGFSYRDCHFKYNSGTFNGDRYSTLPDGTEVPVQAVDGSIRTIGEQCGNLVTSAIENWMRTGKRVLSAEQIIQMTTSGEWSGKLPVCPKITTTPSTTTKFD